MLAVSHRGRPELSQALRISQGECSTSQVAHIIVCNNTLLHAKGREGSLTNMANVTLPTPTCSDTSCVSGCGAVSGGLARAHGSLCLQDYA